MKRTANILYVMDQDLNGMTTLEQLLMLAIEQHATITLVDIVTSLPTNTRMLVTMMPASELGNSVVRNRLLQLEAFASMISKGAWQPQTRVLFGKRAKEITRISGEGRYDLVVKKPEAGKTDGYLLRNCACPVLLLQPDDNHAKDKILHSLQKHSTGNAASPMEIGNGVGSFAG